MNTGMIRLLIVGTPDDLVPEPEVTRAIDRYDNRVFRALRALQLEHAWEGELYTLILTHQGGFVDWKSPVSMKKPEFTPPLVDFSYTAATSSLDVHLEKLWWPTSINRIGVCIAPPYVEVTFDSDQLYDMRDSVDWLSHYKSSDAQMARALKQWVRQERREVAA